MKEGRDSTREHWERVYQGIGRRYRLYRPQPQLLDLLKGIAERIPQGRVLEVGCGKGNELIECAKQGLRCVGIDFSAEALSLLRERVMEDGIEISLLRADAQALPFADHTFDIVFSQGVLEHFRDPRLILEEQRRVLRPGGFVIVEVPNRWTLYTVYKKVLMMVNRWPPGWETQYSPGELKSLLEAHGFDVIDLVGWDCFVWKVFRKVRRLLGLEDRVESAMVRRFRLLLQRNPVMLYLFASLIIVGQKRFEAICTT